jgi:hypothetical protein
MTVWQGKAYTDVLENEACLPPDGLLRSSNGMYTFVNQLDGNLAVYQSSSAAWLSWTNGKGVGRLCMESSGSLVLYDDARNQPIWAARAGNMSAPPYRLVLSDDGQLAIYDSEGTPYFATSWTTFFYETSTEPPVICSVCLHSFAVSMIGLCICSQTEKQVSNSSCLFALR